jgi:hypothetical protein
MKKNPVIIYRVHPHLSVPVIEKSFDMSEAIEADGYIKYHSKNDPVRAIFLYKQCVFPGSLSKEHIKKFIEQM